MMSVLYTLVLVLVITLIILLILWFKQQYRFFKALKRLPGPTPLPIIGSALEFRSIDDILPVLSKWHNRYGSIFKFNIGFLPTNVSIVDYKFIEFLLSSNTILGKSLIYQFFVRWLGTGILTGKGMKWKKFRKLITPAFHFKILEQFVEVFDKNGNILIKSLNKELLSKSFDIYPYITLYTLDVICESALGIEINAQENSESEYVKCVKGMCNLMLSRSINPIFDWEFLYKLSGMYRKEVGMLKVLHETTLSVIKRKRDQLNQNSTDGEEKDREFGIKKKMAFLDLLLQSTVDGRPLSDWELQEEVSTFMFAGHDTTASAISFTLYNLSLYPEIQNKVLEEIKRILYNGSKGNGVTVITYSDLQEMKYLEAVIKENLRLYPPVPMIGRMHEEQFEFDGITYPSGTPLLIDLYHLMRDPKHFPDPEQFNPDRFLVKGHDENHNMPFSYIPFSAGPRNCIGQKFAMLELKSIISKLVLNYEILPAEPDHKVKVIHEITLKSTNGIKIRIGLRKNL